MSMYHVIILHIVTVVSKVNISKHIAFKKNDLSSETYFHSKPLYFYRKINQKGLFKFKGRVLDSPRSDDTVVQF